MCVQYDADYCDTSVAQLSALPRIRQTDLNIRTEGFSLPYRLYKVLRCQHMASLMAIRYVFSKIFSSIAHTPIAVHLIEQLSENSKRLYRKYIRTTWVAYLGIISRDQLYSHLTCRPAQVIITCTTFFEKNGMKKNYHSTAMYYYDTV